MVYISKNDLEIVSRAVTTPSLETKILFEQGCPPVTNYKSSDSPKDEIISNDVDSSGTEISVLGVDLTLCTHIPRARDYREMILNFNNG